MFLQFLFTAFFYSLPVFAVIGLYKNRKELLAGISKAANESRLK